MPASDEPFVLPPVTTSSSNRSFGWGTKAESPDSANQGHPLSPKCDAFFYERTIVLSDIDNELATASYPNVFLSDGALDPVYLLL